MCLAALAIAESSRRHSRISLVCKPVVSAFWLPFGAPEPGAPPCMRHRFFPATAGERQGVPARDFAPHRMLSRIAVVLRKCVCSGLSVTAGPNSHPRRANHRRTDRAVRVRLLAGLHVTDYRLASGLNGYMLHRDLLLALAPVFVERF